MKISLNTRYTLMMLRKAFFLILLTLVDIHQLLYHELFSLLLLMSEAANGGVL